MKVNIAIMAIREDEFIAVRERFETERQSTPDGLTCLIGKVKTDKQTYTIAIARCIDQGTDASQRLAHYIIHNLDPQLILVVGIAGGVPSADFTLGDVVVSTRIVNPNVDAWHADGTTDYSIRGGPPHPLVENIISMLPGEPQLAGWADLIQPERPVPDLEQVSIEGDDEWREKIRESLNQQFGEEKNRGLSPKYITGPIISSNHLMKDPIRLREILKTHRSVLAVEMEAAGVYEAAYGIPHYPVMVIRGISDIVGLQRDSRWTTYACQTAAAFTYAFIMTNPIEQRSGKESSPDSGTDRHSSGNVVNITHKDWDDAPEPDVFFGRTKELDKLKRWIVQERCRLVTIVGMGGIGKTGLSVRLGRGGIGKTGLSLTLARGIQDQFDYVIWRSLLSIPKVTDILKDLIKVLSDQQEVTVPDTVSGQISRLLHYLSQYRCLLILDNAEKIFQGGEHAGHYLQDYEEYGQLFRQVAEVPHQSCLLLTSREKLSDIALQETETGPIRLLELSGLDYLDGKKIFSKIGSFSGSKKEWEELNTFYNGNPLALKLAAHYINDVFSGNISELLREGKPVFAEFQELLDWHFDRLSILHKELMYWLAINREPMTPLELEKDILSSIIKKQVPLTLQSLRRLLPLEKIGPRFTLHPVFIEYMIERLVKQVVEEIRIGSSELLNTHALLKAVAKDYIRTSQVRMILQPVIESLTISLGEIGCEGKLKHLLTVLNDTPLLQAGYAAGNILNLLIYLKANLSGLNFSRLNVRQAYLQEIPLPDVDFSYAYIESCIFTEAFGSVLSVSFSPDGTLLAASVGAGAGSGEIWVVRIADGALLRICKGHSGWIWSVAFSSNGKIIASGGNDHTVRLWDINTRAVSRILEGHEGIVRTVTFSPDGRFLASGSEDRSIRLWKVDTGQCLHILSPHQGRIWSVAFSANGKMFASGSDDGTVCLWKVNSTIENINQPFKRLHLPGKSKVWAIALSSEGNILASGSEDTLVRLWDTHTGTVLKELSKHTGWVRALNFSPDGRTLASSGEEHIIYLWDTDTGHSRLIKGHSGWIRSVHFSPDGKTLASGSEDLSMRLWETKTGSQLKKWQGYNDSVRSVAFSPDGKFLASGGDDQKVRLWDIETGRSDVLHAIGQVWSVTFSPNGELLASGGDDQTIRLWDMRTHQCLKILQGHSNSVRAIAFNSSGNRLASGSLDKTVDIWDLNTEQYMKMPDPHTDRVRSVAFSLDGKFLASGGDDGIIRLWNIETDEFKQLSGHSGRIQIVAFRSEGSLLASGGNDKTVRLWNIETGECIYMLDGHAKTVWSVAFSRNGKLLASGSDDKTIRLWNVETGECLQVLEYTHIVLCIAFSPDPEGSLLASGSDSGIILLWDVQTGARLRTLKSDKPYKGMNITGVRGLKEDQKTTLRALGAIED